MFGSPLGRLRAIGLLEATSFLLLLCVAMPLKYVWAMPLPVKVTGWAHGVLFIAFVLSIPAALRQAGWTWRHGALLFVSALLPAGPLLLDSRLRQAEGAGK